MLVTIIAESEKAKGNKSKAIVFRWEMTLEQLQRLNDVANELVSDNESK